MKEPYRLGPELALFLADVADIYDQLEALNQKLLATLATLPNSSGWIQSLTEQPNNSSVN